VQVGPSAQETRDVFVETDPSICETRAITVQTDTVVYKNMSIQTVPLVFSTVDVQTDPAVSTKAIAIQTDSLTRDTDVAAIQTESIICNAVGNQTDTPPVGKAIAAQTDPVIHRTVAMQTDSVAYGTVAVQTNVSLSTGMELTYKVFAETNWTTTNKTVAVQTDRLTAAAMSRDMNNTVDVRTYGDDICVTKGIRTVLSVCRTSIVRIDSFARCTKGVQTDSVVNSCNGNNSTAVQTDLTISGTSVVATQTDARETNAMASTQTDNLMSMGVVTSSRFIIVWRVK